MKRPSAVRSTFGVLALAVLVALSGPSASARTMPADPTEALSTAPDYRPFFVRSTDYERIEQTTWAFTEESGALYFDVNGLVRLLSTDRRDYAAGIFVGAWLDVNGDRAFDSADRVVNRVLFPNPALSQTVPFTGRLPLPANYVIPDGGTYLRVLLSYDHPAGPIGETVYGDVKDYLLAPPEDEGKQHRVELIEPTVIPDVFPGRTVQLPPFYIQENVPGALRGWLIFVAPKGTAVALARSNGRVQRGNILLGAFRAKKRLGALRVQDESTEASVVQVNLALRIAPDFRGELTLHTNIGGRKLTLARVVEPRAPPGGGVKVGAASDPLPTISADQTQEVSPVLFEEEVSGAIKTGTLTLDAPEEIQFSKDQKVSVRVKKGDLRIGKVKVTDRSIEVEVLEESTSASEIEVCCAVDVDSTYDGEAVDLGYALPESSDTESSLALRVALLP